MNYGVIRVSTDKQDSGLSNQRHEILELANKRQWVVNDWIEETASGAKSYRHRELGQLMEHLESGDRIIVTEISRIGRSIMDVMECLNRLMEMGVEVYSCKEGFELNDSLGSKVLAFAFSMSAEVERQLISARTREALARRRAEGKHVGRPMGSLSGSKLDEHREQIVEFLSKGVSKASIAKIYNCSRSTLYSFLERRDLLAS